MTLGPSLDLGRIEVVGDRVLTTASCVDGHAETALVIPEWLIAIPGSPENQETVRVAFKLNPVN